MAQAKRKNTTKQSRRLARQTAASQLYKGAIGRMEKIIATLEDCVVTEGWHESWKAGPMPKQAADVVSYLRARAGGARENATKENKVNAFVAHCGQSLDWLFTGDPRGLICKAAGHSPQAASLQSSAAESNAMVTSERAQEIASGMFELEEPVRNACNLAMACRMLASSDGMPKEAGRSLDTVADTLVEKLEALETERERIWQLAVQSGAA